MENEENEDKDEKIRKTNKIIGKSKIKGEILHIELKVALVSKENYEKAPNRIRLYAVSEDNGKNWYFVDYKIYESDYCKKFKRLIKK